jgi:Mg2+/Co2+ transporter CorC
MILAMSAAVLFVSHYAWLGGGMAVVALIVSMALSRLRIFRSIGRSVYTSSVSNLLPWTAKQQWLDYFSEHIAVGKKIGLETYDELVSVIDNAPFLRHTEVHQLKATITSRDDTARDHMLPLSDVATISSTDVIGPLLLDELHKTHQKDFLVVDDKGTIIGTAQLKNLIEMSRVSSNVGDVMQPHVLRVHPGVKLRELFDTMVTHKAWLAVIRDGEDIGVVSLGEITTTLLGKLPK